jgi:hypothetical protein
MTEALFPYHRNRNIHLVWWLEAPLFHDTTTCAMLFNRHLSISLVPAGVVSGVLCSISASGTLSILKFRRGRRSSPECSCIFGMPSGPFHFLLLLFLRSMRYLGGFRLGLCFSYGNVEV